MNMLASNTMMEFVKDGGEDLRLLNEVGELHKTLQIDPVIFGR